MKLQIDQQTLRWRVDEAELAELLANGQLHRVTRFGPADSFSISLLCLEGRDASLHRLADHWTLGLPHSALEAHLACLPSRDALHVSIAHSPDLDVRFEVDVRDSLRLRGPGKRPR